MAAGRVEKVKRGVYALTGGSAVRSSALLVFCSRSIRRTEKVLVASLSTGAYYDEA
jgi:hypothetical protein